MNGKNNDKNNIENQTYIKKIKGIKIPIILSIIIMIISIPFIYDMFFVEHTGAFDFSALGDLVVIILGIRTIIFIWILYFIICTIKKLKKKDETWWKPLLLVFGIIIFVSIISVIYETSNRLNDNKESFSKKEPEIVSYESLSAMPLLEGYKEFGKELDEHDVYNNVKKYKNEKVFIKGTPSSFTTEGVRYGDTEKFSISNFDETNQIIYQFTFVDKKSEFTKDNYIFFSTDETENGDYFVYVYGTISSSQEGYDGTKAINIIPDKIYYTLDWNEIFESDNIIYSECAKVNNQCTQEDISKGQIVNVSVNDNENYDFYVINDDGINLTLYGYRALGEVEYLSKDDNDKLLKENNIILEDCLGPYTLMKKLNELTSTWTNIKPIDNFSFYTYADNSYNNIEIVNGKTVITSRNGNIINVPGNTVARVISNNELNNYNSLEFYGLPCLRNTEIHHHKYCHIWSYESHKYSYDVAETIKASFRDMKIETQIENEYVQEKRFIVPVIKIPKSEINDR